MTLPVQFEATTILKHSPARILGITHTSLIHGLVDSNDEKSFKTEEGTLSRQAKVE